MIYGARLPIHTGSPIGSPRASGLTTAQALQTEPVSFVVEDYYVVELHKINLVLWVVVKAAELYCLRLNGLNGLQ